MGYRRIARFARQYLEPRRGNSTSSIQSDHSHLDPETKSSGQKLTVVYWKYVESGPRSAPSIYSFFCCRSARPPAWQIPTMGQLFLYLSDVRLNTPLLTDILVRPLCLMNTKCRLGDRTKPALALWAQCQLLRIGAAKYLCTVSIDSKEIQQGLQ